VVSAAVLIKRGQTRLGPAIGISVLVHLVLFVVANQLPSSRYRIVPRLRVIQVRLLYPEPVPEPERKPTRVAAEEPSEQPKGWEEPPSPLEPQPALPEPELAAELPAPSLDLPEPTATAASRSLPDEPSPLSGDLERRQVPTRSSAPEFTDELPGGDVAQRGPDVPGLSVEGWDELLATPPENVVAARRRGPDLTQLAAEPGGLPDPEIVARAVPSRRAVGRTSSPAPPIEAPPSGAGRRRLRTVEPEVPAWVEEQGIETSTALRIEIREDGRIGNTWLTRSSGYRELDNLANAAVREWLYEPGLKEQRAVIIHFRLR
jgi:TonB family protein